MSAELTVHIANHAADAGELLSNAGETIGSYHVARRFRQQPGEYAGIHATIDGIEYEGTKFERSRKGQVKLTPDPFGKPICDCEERCQKQQAWEAAIAQAWQDD